MTEKNYNSEQMMAKTMKKQQKVQKIAEPENLKPEKQEKSEAGEIEKKESAPEQKKDLQKSSKLKEKQKRTKAIVNAFDLPVSTKHSSAICRFIKRKKIQEAIKDLELVARIKKPVPMKGEIPHRKGRMMSGRFPEKAAREFIVLLKSLASNSSYYGLENPVIEEAVANIGSRPFGRRGIRRKRTHIRIVAEDAKGKNIRSGETEKKQEIKNEK